MAKKAPKKRNKAHRPKHVQIPVMPEMQREFQFCMHGALAALQDVLVRAETTGCLAVRRFELPAIENAVLECEGLLPRLDIVRLHIARQKTFAAGRALRAAPNHPQEEEIAA